MRAPLVMLALAVAALAAVPARAAPPPVLAAPASVLVVTGTSSLTNSGERLYAQSAARRLDRWLTDLGVPHALTDDDAFTRQGAGSARLVVLPLNPSPSRAELGAIERFVKAGGRLIVCFSDNPALARLMQVQTGPCLADLRGERWAAMRFAAHAPPHTPPRVVQTSRVLRTIEPIPGGPATVIAFWENAAGQVQPEAAWIQSPHGFWMSHLLLDDGDTAGKQRLLLALTASGVPGAWEPAARRSVARAETLGKYADFAATAQAITAFAQGKPAAAATALLLDRAIGERNQLAALLALQDYPSVVQAASGLDRTLVEAYALARDSVRDDLRGVWDHSGAGLYPGDWDRTCRTLAAHGLTDLFVNMLSAGYAHYPSRLLAPSPLLNLRGDQLAACVQAAHANGLRVHAWKLCWNLEGAPESVVAELRRQGRLQVSDTGSGLNWLCPSHPLNVTQERAAIDELVRRYPVDGVHLDYVRYPDAHACFCEGCRRRFARYLGHSPSRWPIPVSKSPDRATFDRWRAGQITHLVEQIAQVVRATNTSMKVSAAVFGTYPSCATSVSQDWGAWLKQGLVDFVCPMDYTADLVQFDKLVRKQLAQPDAAGRVYPGIGVTAAESWLGPVPVIDQISAVRQAGGRGFVLFALTRVLEQEILPTLKPCLDAGPAEQLER